MGVIKRGPAMISLTAIAILPEDAQGAALVGRVWLGARRERPHRRSGEQRDECSPL
jgi:hypothetical protein